MLSLQAEFPANTNILYVDLPSAELIASRESETSFPGMVFNTKKPITYMDQFGIQHQYVPRTFDAFAFTRVPGGRLECTMQNIADNFFNAHSSQRCEGVEGIGSVDYSKTIWIPLLCTRSEGRSHHLLRRKEDMVTSLLLGGVGGGGDGEGERDD
ncbi:hypothetical protein RHGRI_033789 [Rhododendron griersonianum]|uniref:Uncharacterized protein n=1 Tax=Rhododendron griersonianum TaxID=479676 RepID=A0AAV6HYT0_9ERIC|nr:hypothetical protein RHGRI_033789 [Rhododendron griersonianum]